MIEESMVKDMLATMSKNCLLLEGYQKRINYIKSNYHVASSIDKNEMNISVLETELKIGKIEEYIFGELDNNLNLVISEWFQQLKDS